MRVWALVPVWAVARGPGGLFGPRSRVHAKARSREVPMREGHFFARDHGPRLWSRFSTKAILGDSRRPPGGPGCWQALGHVGRDGLLCGLAVSSFAILAWLWAAARSHPRLVSRCAPGSAARGPGRPGLLSCCQGRQACLTSDHDRGPGGYTAEKGQRLYHFFFLSDFTNGRYSSVVIPAFSRDSIVLGSFSRF